MKRTIVTSIILAAAVVFTGCNHNELKPGSGAQGELSLQIVPKGDFTPLPETKATDDVQVDVSTFSLSVNSGDKTVLSWDKFSDVPSVIGLDPGTYTIVAKSPGNKAVEWLQPKYQGSQEVTVVPGEVENIVLTCILTNMKVTILTTEKFRNEMEDYTVTVNSDNGDGFLNFTKAIIEEGRSGYFDPSPLTIDLNATRKQKEGVAMADINVIHTYHIESGAAQDHHVITLDASETGYADLGSGITVDYTVNERNEDILIDGLEENPVQDKPVLSSSTVADGAEDVPVDTKTIGLSYSTNVKLAEGAAITLGESACEASVSGNLVTVTLPALTEGTQYTLNVPAGAVMCDGNEELVADALALTFTIASAGQEPEPEEPETSAITITATAGIDEPVTYSKNEVNALIEQDQFSFKLSVDAVAGIEKFEVTVESAGLKGLIDMMKTTYPELDYKVDLANMSEADLTFWAVMVFPGLTSEDVKGKNKVEFEIGNFLPAMAVGEINKMAVMVTDVEGNEASATLQIEMKD